MNGFAGRSASFDIRTGRRIFIVSRALPMRLAILIYVLFGSIAVANPLSLASIAGDRLYIASEQLTVTVSSNRATLRGVFRFNYRQDVPSPGQKSQVGLRVPVWFPELNPEERSVAEFWKAFADERHTEVNADTKDAFERALALRVFLADRPLEFKRFALLTPHDYRMVWAPPEWRQEPGFCCLAFDFYFQDDSVLVQNILTILWQQPLLQAKGEREFYYVPVFEGLPKGMPTTDKGRYLVTITADSGCSLTVSSAGEKATIEPGRSEVFSPRHHQAIRVMVTTRANPQGGANGRQPVRSETNRMSAEAAPRRSP